MPMFKKSMCLTANYFVKQEVAQKSLKSNEETAIIFMNFIINKSTKL